jgi:hypothetical protein
MPKRKGKAKPSNVLIEDLPASDETADTNELEILSSILDVHETDPQEYNRLKFVFYATAIFIFLSLPFVDKVVEMVTPLASSWLVLLVLKTIVFFILYYIVSYSQG